MTQPSFLQKNRILRHPPLPFSILLLLLFPCASYAHQSSTKITNLYSGILFVLSSPAHLLILIALAFVTIQIDRKPLSWSSLFAVVFLIGLPLGTSTGNLGDLNPLYVFLLFILTFCTFLPEKTHRITLVVMTSLTALLLGYGAGIQATANESGLHFLTGVAFMELTLFILALTLVPKKLTSGSGLARGVTRSLIIGAGILLFLLDSTSSLSIQDISVFSEEGLLKMVEREEMNLTFVCTTLLFSLLWGAGHALTPGHGKAIVGAYLIGARSTPWHAFYLGLTVTITHTLGIFCLGLVALFASHYILPETLFPWLAAISGLIVLSLGMTMLVSRLRSLLEEKKHRHFHAHGHDHGHHHHHHSHLPPETDSPVSWKTLLGLGISGGLLPCPSALVLLLAAISIHRIGFGMALVFTFSIGLAGVLTMVGLLFIKGSKVLHKIPQASAITSTLPILSAFLIFTLGGFITWDAIRSLAL